MESTPATRPDSTASNDVKPFDEKDREFARLEYSALRDEMIKRIEILYNILNWILIISGTFLGVGVQVGISGAVLLVYPVLALFLVIYWRYNRNAVRVKAAYIRDYIEGRLGYFGWESYVRTAFGRKQVYGISGDVAMGGLVLTCQALAIGLALVKMTGSLVEIILLVASLIAFTATIAIFINIRLTAHTDRSKRPTTDR